MIKLLSLLWSLAFINSQSLAQSNEYYHIFSYERKHGVTDTLANEILPPKYWYPDKLYLKDQWIFKNDQEGVIFNRKDGKARHYEEVRSYHLEFLDSMYMRITDKGKMYLLNQYSDTRYDLPKNRANIKAIGNYFYTTTTIWPKSQSYRDKKTGKLMPPPVVRPIEHMEFFKHPADARPLLEIGAKKVTPLWKYSQLVEDHSTTCDYIVFTTEKQIKIYDHNLKFIKAIPKPDQEYIDIDNLVSDAIGLKVFYRGASPSYAEPGKITYPLLISQKEGDQYQVALQQNYNDKNPVIIFTTSYEVSCNRNIATLKKENKEYAQFSINLKNGEMYLPGIYKEKLGLDFSSKNKTLLINIKDNSEIFQKVDEIAQLAGGPNAIHHFISNNLTYPDEAKKAGVYGRVTVKFIVETDGSISNVKITRSLSAACDAEVLRIIKKMPTLIPAKINGTPVRSYYTLPITFQVID